MRQMWSNEEVSARVHPPSIQHIYVRITTKDSKLQNCCSSPPLSRRLIVNKCIFNCALLVFKCRKFNI